MVFDRMSAWPKPPVGAVAVVGIALLAVACVKPEPRRFEEFLDDSIARDGTLARCNQNRDDTSDDIECANARRAAAAIALMEERARRTELERESERKLAALRAEIERRDRAKREAMAAALAAAEAAYEAQWAEEGIEFGDEVDEFEPVQPPMTDSAQNLDPSDSAAGTESAAIPRPFQ